jgi:hypothetical protein
MVSTSESTTIELRSDCRLLQVLESIFRAALELAQEFGWPGSTSAARLGVGEAHAIAGVLRAARKQIPPKGLEELMPRERQFWPWSCLLDAEGRAGLDRLEDFLRRAHVPVVVAG